jgi:hypothetical protein
MAQLCAGKMYATRPGFVFNSAISGLETILAVLGAILLHLGRPGQLRRQASGAARAKPAVLNLQRPSLCETRTFRWSDVHSNPWFLDVPIMPIGLGEGPSSGRTLRSDPARPVFFASFMVALPQGRPIAFDAMRHRTLYHR